MTTNLTSQPPFTKSNNHSSKEIDNSTEQSLNNAIQGLIVINNSHQIIGWNPISSYLTGYKREEIINTSILDLIPSEEEKKDFLANFERLSEFDETMDVYHESTVHLVTPCGQENSVNLQWNRMIVAGEKIFNICISNLVFTQKFIQTAQEKDNILIHKEKQLAKLTSSNKQLESFAYVASHDLKEPLRSIGNFTQLLGRRLENKLDETDKEFFGFVTSGVKNMNSLIEDLLTYSRVNSGKNELVNIVPKDALAIVLNGLNQRVVETNAQIEIKELPAQITGNSTTFKQLLQNLIANAIKFQNPEMDPKITISGEEQKDRWVFRVSDNGIGIKEEYYEKVFSVFTKLHHKSVYPGSGIGLSVCQRIVEQHDGEIWIDSVFGKGTNFYFSIAKHLCNSQH